METDVTEDSGLRFRRLPEHSGMRHLAWGLATFGLSFIPYWATVEAGVEVYAALKSSGVMPGPAPPPQFVVPESVWPAVAIPVTLGPAVLAGLVAARRWKWWVGPLAGVVFGAVAGGATLFATPSGDWEGVMTVPQCWVSCGLTGSLVSAIRRRRGW